VNDTDGFKPANRIGRDRHGRHLPWAIAQAIPPVIPQAITGAASAFEPTSTSQTGYSQGG